jgi:hypothetical protein
MVLTIRERVDMTDEWAKFFDTLDQPGAIRFTRDRVLEAAKTTIADMSRDLEEAGRSITKLLLNDELPFAILKNQPRETARTETPRANAWKFAMGDSAFVYLTEGGDWALNAWLDPIGLPLKPGWNLSGHYIKGKPVDLEGLELYGANAPVPAKGEPTRPQFTIRDSGLHWADLKSNMSFFDRIKYALK